MRTLWPLAFVAVTGCSTQNASSVVDAGASDASANLSGDAGDAGVTYYLPAGYTLTPFATDSATTHTFAKADQVIDPNKSYVAVLETGAGRIVWQLSATEAPIACNSFVFLTLHHFFDGIAFHRVIDGFVAQGGDPNSINKPQATWGTGGPGYTFDNELFDGGPTFDDDAGGVVAMANTGQPNSNGSQFFITFGAQAGLDGGYTIFGRVLEGMDVLPLIIRGEPPPATAQPGWPTRMIEVHIGEKANP